MCKFAFLLLCLAAGFSACSQISPKFIAVGHHPLLDSDGGANLLADVCIRYDDVGDANDHFIGEDSRAGASDLLAMTKQYFLENGLPIHSERAPFVCGAIHNAGNTPQQFATKFDEKAVTSRQPFAVVDDLKHDENYGNALSKISTYVFQHAISAGKRVDSRNIFSNENPYIVSAAEFKAATAVVAAKQQRSNLVVLGITGIRESEGKAQLKAVGHALLSVALTAAGIAATGWGRPVTITPRGQLVYWKTWTIFPISLFAQGSTYLEQAVAGLVNTKTGELVWVNSIIGEAISQPNSIDVLLFDLVHRSSPSWNPPGAPSQ